MRLALLLAVALPALGSAAEPHWAFQPVQRPPVPRLPTQPANPIDAFILAKLQEKGIPPAPEADRRTLLRRLSFDLTGLPPTPEELATFEADTRPDAYERQVERLLASPHYGERWARHWLDLARYADSEGYESDHVRPYAWRYRDWVVRAFNADRPYDRFLTEQIAGDELVPYSDDHLIATGFLAAARLSSNEEDKARQLNDVYVDIANTTASTFLGLTLQCAQCHSHKIDPISLKDYYRFQGFFLTGLPYNLALQDPAGWKAHRAAKPPEYESAKQQLTALFEAGKARLDAKARASLTPEQKAARDTPADQRTPDQHRLALEADLLFQYTANQVENALPAADKPRYAELKQKVATLEAAIPEPPQTWGFYSPVTSPHRIDPLSMRGFYPPPFDPVALARAKPFLLQAGDPTRRGLQLDVGWPAVLGPTPAGTRSRTDLVRWLTDRRHPLTARVWVNRVWQYHFGRGIVETPSDFGLRGAKPTHPELLDWLAAELMEPTVPPTGGGPWALKRLHKLIVTSETYRRASQPDSVALRIDPDNKLLWRWTPRRLEAEAIRDAMLAVSGDLDPTPGGPPLTDDPKVRQRTLYLLQKRQRPTEVQRLFDAPTAATESCPLRITTTTPLHALFLLNGDFARIRAESLAVRARGRAGADSERAVAEAFRLTLQRPPTEEERAKVRQLVRNPAAQPDPFAALCWVLLNTNEFLYIE